MPHYPDQNQPESALRTPTSGSTTLTPSTLTEKSHQDRTLEPTVIKRATRTRRNFAFFTSFCFLVTCCFLILVELGNTRINHNLNKIYFLYLDLSNIIPLSVPNAVLFNSIARTIGLHDFYTVGLWNFCEGYNGEGITNCSDPKEYYWFDPVTIILDELLSGASVALPTSITSALKLVRIASRWMYALFMTGTVFSFISIFITPLSIYTRWATLLIALFTSVAAITTTIATVIATAMFVIFRNTFSSASELSSFNVVASLGPEMFAFMWIATFFSLIAFLVQTALCCCCASRRDVKTGRKMGNWKAYIVPNASGIADVSLERMNPRKRWKRLKNRTDFDV